MPTNPKSLTAEEEAKLITYFEDACGTDHLCQVQLHKISAIYLMLDAGLRLAETSKLHWQHLMLGDTLADAITIVAAIAKGGRERIIPETPRLKSTLEQLLKYQKTGPYDYKMHPVIRYKGMARGTSRRQIERWILHAGARACGRRITPHMLRHTFATKLMRITNIRTVQELLGHKRLSSTQVYTHPSIEDSKKAIHQLS